MKQYLLLVLSLCLASTIGSDDDKQSLITRMSELHQSTSAIIACDESTPEYERYKIDIEKYPLECFFAQKLALLDQPGVGVFNDLPPYKEFTAEILLRKRNELGIYEHQNENILDLIPEHLGLDNIQTIVTEFTSLVDSDDNDKMCQQIAQLSKNIAENIAKTPNLCFTSLKQTEKKNLEEKEEEVTYDNNDKIDYDSEDEEYEHIEKTFFEILRHWLYEFGEPTVAYACSIVLPYLIQEIHHISTESMLAAIPVTLVTIHLVREKILERKIYQALSTATMVAGIIAYTAYTQKQS